MRSDAKKNYDHLLEVGREIFAEQGTEASLRDVARRAGVGIGTLYRHFPTREALLEALLRGSFDEVTAKAAELETEGPAEDALVSWLGEMVALTHSRRGLIASMTAAIADEDSALHVSCVALRGSGARLLARAQAAGKARLDIDGTDLLALISALAWLNDQPPFASRVDKLFSLVTNAILTDPVPTDTQLLAAGRT
jgi:AcrR family transcriptional regulator